MTSQFERARHPSPRGGPEALRGLSDGLPDRSRAWRRSRAAKEGSYVESPASQAFWDGANEEVPLLFDPGSLNFRDLFDAYLRPGGSCFEVGCYPGRFLVYLCKRFGYTANGIDATPFVRTRMPAFLREHGVAIGRVLCEDFRRFQPDGTYDVVCSFGFVEHFVDVEAVIEKHVALVKDGGTLVLACPNFRRLQYLFHRVFDAENLRRHVLPSMDLRRWRTVLEANGMNVLHHGYYRTAALWTATPPGRIASAFSGPLVAFADFLDRRVDRPNAWLSPFLVSVSRKPARA